MDDEKFMPAKIFSNIKTVLDKEGLNPTMAGKLIVNVAPTGSFTTREQNPNQPYTPKEIAEQVIKCYKLGAAVWHVHCRDDMGIPNKDPEVIIKTIDMVLAECPDIITSINVISNYSERGIKRISPIVDALSSAGPQYIRTAVITPQISEFPSGSGNMLTSREFVDVVNYLKDKGVKPEFQAHYYTTVKEIEEYLINNQIIKVPYLINTIMGFHAFHYAGPTQPDPWGFIYLASMLNTLPAGTVKGLTAGGRNWLPVTMVGTVLGVDMIRVGMEDAVWLYPHKNELIPDCAEVVRKTAAIVKELGRDIASPEEARGILGI